MNAETETLSSTADAGGDLTADEIRITENGETREFQDDETEIVN